MNLTAPLAPTPYQREIRDYLREHEPALWSWFSHAQQRNAPKGQVRVELLKTNYRLAPADHPDLYAELEQVRRILGVDAPVTLYQSQSGSAQLNASLFHLPDEAHIVLSGPLVSLLQPDEWRAVFGHELAHRLLWLMEGGDFLVVDRILEATVNDPRSGPVHGETTRRFRLHTEIFADRGALQAAGDLAQTVTALVKISTGMSVPSGETYLTQAAEIVAQGGIRSVGTTHPEMYLRAHALARWVECHQEADTQIRAMIGGEPAIENLDLPDQHRISRLTRRFIAQLLRPTWFRSDAVLAQARLYFTDFVPADTEDPSLVTELKAESELVPSYFAFVLLDFVNADAELEQLPLAAGLRWAEELEITSSFEALLVKELGLKARELAKLKPKAAELLANAAPAP